MSSCEFHKDGDPRPGNRRDSEPYKDTPDVNPLQHTEFDEQLRNPYLFIVRFESLTGRDVENLHVYPRSPVQLGGSDIHFIMCSGETIDLFGATSDSGILARPDDLRALVTAGSSLHAPHVSQSGRLLITLQGEQRAIVFNCHSGRLDFPE